ncbi:hypothetical protein [Paraburkholderia azotifigens]|uniref:Apea-like HEPN domain-containing protein n=1 Tax=Paraburkholderia azotifigens TaxID=2057004 RepID=A0ABU9R6F5_9BURK
MIETREIKLESWDRFATPNLDVEYHLVGQSHVFPYMGATVTLSLPEHERIAEGRDAGYVHEWQMVDEQQIPQKVFVHQVDVCVQRGHCITLPAEVLSRAPKAFDLIEADDQKRLDTIVGEANDIASNAFEYWLSIMRWKSGNYRIGRPGIPDNSTGWSTYLRESVSLARVWIAPNIIAVSASDPVTRDEWESVRSALEICQEVPIHLKFFDDAQESFSRHEFRRSIIDLAIACEVFMRTLVLQRLPPDLDPDVRAMVEDANINQYMRKFVPNALTEEGKRRLKALASAQLESMFAARNKIMHMAKEDRATGENCLRFIRAVETLFEIGAMTT